MIRYQAKIKKDGNKYWIEFPDLPGCLTQGSSKEETLERAREALSLYLEEARDEKWEIPKAKSRTSTGYHWVTPYEDVAIALMIRQARLKRGLTQRELSAKLGMTIQQLQKLETPGKSNPTVRTLAAISKALDEELEIRLAG